MAVACLIDNQDRPIGQYAGPCFWVDVGPPSNAPAYLGPGWTTRVPILMYHSISDNLFGKSHPYFQIDTAPDVFSVHMRRLRHAG